MRLKTSYALVLVLSIFVCVLSVQAKTERVLENYVENASLQDNYKVHSVKKGQTVYSIAKSYNIGVNDIYNLNNWARKGINVGDKLKIPKEEKSNNISHHNNKNTGQVKEPSKPIAGYRDHVIETKQTLYSLALIYNVTVEDILNANPGLSADNFQTGRTIQIPVYKDNLPDMPAANPGATDLFKEHIVKKGETIYGISKAYDIAESDLYKYNPSLQDGLKADMKLSIPASSVVSQPSTLTLSDVIQPTPEMKKGETMKIGVLMPFLDKNGMIQQDKLIEYYNGLLLGVKELKAKGYSIDLYTFDIGTDSNTKKLKSLLETVEMKDLHLIIGGVSPKQIEMLTEFSRETGIKYVIPFGSKKENVKANVFQANTSHAYLYPKITAIFKNRFKGYNIIFVSETGSDNNKADFVKELKAELTNASVPFKNIVSSEDILQSLKQSVNQAVKNIIIPTSSSEITLKKLMSIADMMSDANLSFFGYPDWQTYMGLYEQLHKKDSYIFSTFFIDEKQAHVQNLLGEYKKWYNKNMVYSFPRFGFLGYDTALYFMTALNLYGSHFDEHLSSVEVPTLQTSMYFEPDIEYGGYVNTGVYFIRFKPDMTFEKIEYTK